MVPEIDVYYYPEDRLWTDEDGKEIKNIYFILKPVFVRLFYRDQISQQFPTKLFGEDCIVNAFWFEEDEEI